MNLNCRRRKFARIMPGLLSLSLALGSIHAIAGDANAAPYYLQPEVELLWNPGWMTDLKPVNTSTNSDATPFTSRILVDGAYELDLNLDTDRSTWESLYKQPLIELGIPMSGRRYVFTSMQSVLDYMTSADMLAVQTMVEDEYAKQNGQSKSQRDDVTVNDTLADADDLSDRDGFSENASLLRTAVKIDARPIASSHSSPHTAQPPINTAKYRRAAGWETNESVWVVDYPYVPGCGTASIVGIRCPGVTSRDRNWNSLTYHLDTGFFSSPDSAVVTSHGGVEDHVYTPTADNTRLEIWGSGVKGIVMGRFADMTLSVSPGVVTMGRSPANCPGPIPCVQSMVEYAGTTILFKSPQFWSFCSLFPNCRNAFQLPDPVTVGRTMLPIEGFQLIPDATATYFSYPVAHNVGEVRVTSYATRTSDPNQQDLARRNGEGWAALMEAASGCDNTLALPRYTNPELFPVSNVRGETVAIQNVDHGYYCPVPRKMDRQPLLNMRNLVTGRMESVFFWDHFCIDDQNNALCLSTHATHACDLRDLNPRTHDLSVLGPDAVSVLSGNGFSRCMNLNTGYQYNRAAIH